MVSPITDDTRSVRNHPRSGLRASQWIVGVTTVFARARDETKHLNIGDIWKRSNDLVFIYAWTKRWFELHVASVRRADPSVCADFSMANAHRGVIPFVSRRVRVT